MAQVPIVAGGCHSKGAALRRSSRHRSARFWICFHAGAGCGCISSTVCCSSAVVCRRAPKETASALMRELTELDRIHLVLALQRHTSKAQLQHQACRGERRWGRHAPLLLLVVWKARGLVWQRHASACLPTCLSLLCSVVGAPTCGRSSGRHSLCYTHPPLVVQETHYVDDLVKQVKREAHAQHSKLTRCVRSPGALGPAARCQGLRHAAAPLQAAAANPLLAPWALRCYRRPVFSLFGCLQAADPQRGDLPAAAAKVRQDGGRGSAPGNAKLLPGTACRRLLSLLSRHPCAGCWAAMQPPRLTTSSRGVVALPPNAAQRRTGMPLPRRFASVSEEPASWRQLAAVGFASGLPFVVFGILDNGIMVRHVVYFMNLLYCTCPEAAAAPAATTAVSRHSRLRSLRAPPGGG